jgi:hypothetical protein
LILVFLCELSILIMETTLPDLPFQSIGILTIPDEPRSPSENDPRAKPKTDLKTLQPWTSLTNDIDSVIRTAMADRNTPPSGAPLLVGNLIRFSTEVVNEDDLCAHVKMELFAAARDVLEALGINGDFKSIGALVGRPGFAWVSGATGMKHAKLVVRNIQRTFTRQRLISPSCM